MITDSFDNKTMPIFTLKDFYGERKRMLDTCLILFSKEIYEAILDAYPCTKIVEIHAANGLVPIYKFTQEGKDIAAGSADKAFEDLLVGAHRHGRIMIIMKGTDSLEFLSVLFQTHIL